MKASQMRDMAVVSIEDAEKIGTVHDLLVNPDGQRVVALQIKTAQGKEISIVPVDEIASIGRDAITIHDSRGIATEIAMEEATVHLSKLLGTKVLTHSGNLLGTVAEVEMDVSTFTITGYELSTGAVSDVIGNRKKLSSYEGVHYGRDILMVRDPGESRYEDREVIDDRERVESRAYVEEERRVPRDDAPYVDDEDVTPESRRMPR
jgi:uncharacterized protein YrrD